MQTTTKYIWSRIARMADGPAEGGGAADAGAEGTEPAPAEGAAVAATGAEGEGGASSGREAGSAAGAAPPSKPVAPSAPSTDWKDKRIATLTARLREEQAKAAAAPAAQQPAATAAADLTAAEIDRLAGVKAQQLSAQAEFNRQCNEVATKGRTTYGETEFNSRIASLRQLTDPADQQSIASYNNLVLAALETDAADRLLFELGADLNEAQRLMGLTPVKLAMALAKLAAAVPVQVSKVAKPITPIGSRGSSHDDVSADDPERADGLDTATWMKRREAELARRNAA